MNYPDAVAMLVEQAKHGYRCPLYIGNDETCTCGLWDACVAVEIDAQVIDCIGKIEAMRGHIDDVQKVTAAADAVVDLLRMLTGNP